MDFLKCSIRGKTYGTAPYEEIVAASVSSDTKGKEKRRSGKLSSPSIAQKEANGNGEGGSLHTPNLDTEDIDEQDVFIPHTHTHTHIFFLPPPHRINRHTYLRIRNYWTT